MARSFGARLGIVCVVVVGIATAACGSDLPHDNGVKWDCIGVARNCPKDVNGNPTSAGEDCVVGVIGPFNGIPIALCADPDVPQTDLRKACETECKNRFRAFGLKSSPPYIWISGLDACPISNVVRDPLTKKCEDPPPPEFLNGGPSDLTLTVSGTAHVDIDGHSGNTTATGAIDVTITRCGAEQCPIEISRVELSATNFEIRDTPITGVTLDNKGISSGTWTRSTGGFDLPSLSLAIGINFRVDDDTGSVTLRNDVLLHGQVNADGSGFHLSGSFSRDDVSAQFDLSGTPRSFPPIANFTPAGPTIECNTANGANATFTSTATDRDNDIAGTVWSIDSGPFVSGREVTTFLSLGTHSITQDVFDTRAATGVASATIEVRDTTAPALAAQPDQIVVGCADDGAVVPLALPTSTDLCGSSTISATITDINGVPTSIPYVSGYRFRQGRTTIRIEASDTSGNRSVVEQHVVVERGAACCPAGLSVVQGTSAGEQINGGNKKQCIDGLGGADRIDPGNSGDFVFAGAGADVIVASNSGDTIFGGSDNDQITGGNGTDVLWGGPGDDVLSGGNGADVLRGGAGRDTMDGGDGPDRFIIAAACEAVSGEIIRGGKGVDTVESPLTRAELEARGVILEDIENVVVVAPLSSSECQ